MIITDLLGNQIAVPQAILNFNEHFQAGEVFDDITKVIEKPAMLFQVNEPSVKLYYLRAIGWNKTILIEAQENNHHFEVINYQLDPPLQLLAELTRKGQRLI